MVGVSTDFSPLISDTEALSEYDESVSLRGLPASTASSLGI